MLKNCFFFKRPDLHGAECSCWRRKNPPTDWHYPPVLHLPTPLSSNPFPLRSLSTVTPTDGLLLSPNPHADSGDTNRTTKKSLSIRLSAYRIKLLPTKCTTTPCRRTNQPLRYGRLPSISWPSISSVARKSLNS